MPWTSCCKFSGEKGATECVNCGPGEHKESSDHPTPISDLPALFPLFGVISPTPAQCNFPNSIGGVLDFNQIQFLISQKPVSFLIDFKNHR